MGLRAGRAGGRPGIFAVLFHFNHGPGCKCDCVNALVCAHISHCRGAYSFHGRGREGKWNGNRLGLADSVPWSLPFGLEEEAFTHKVVILAQRGRDVPKNLNTGKMIQGELDSLICI